MILTLTARAFPRLSVVAGEGFTGNKWQVTRREGGSHYIKNGEHCLFLCALIYQLEMSGVEVGGVGVHSGNEERISESTMEFGIFFFPGRFLRTRVRQVILGRVFSCRECRLLCVD